MLKDYIEESIETKQKILNDPEFLDKLERIINLLKSGFKSGNKLLIAGNGGSAADAQHFAAEIVARYKKDRKGYPAIALTTDSSILTAWSNDVGFESAIARQIEALGQKGDLFFGLSTSSNSPNIISAVDKANEMGLVTICLLGKDGGKLKDKAAASLIVPSFNTPRIQEAHVMLIHIISEELEKDFH